MRPTRYCARCGESWPDTALVERSPAEVDLRPACMDCGARVDVHQVPASAHGAPVNRPCGCVAASLDFRHLATPTRIR